MITGNFKRDFYYADLVTAKTLCRAIDTAIRMVAAMCARHRCDPASCAWSVRPGPGGASLLYVAMSPVAGAP